MAYLESSRCQFLLNSSKRRLFVALSICSLLVSVPNMATFTNYVTIRLLPEMLIISKILNKFLICNEKRRFPLVFTTACHQSLATYEQTAHHHVPFY